MRNHIDTHISDNTDWKHYGKFNCMMKQDVIELLKTMTKTKRKHFFNIKYVSTDGCVVVGTIYNDPEMYGNWILQEPLKIPSTNLCSYESQHSFFSTFWVCLSGERRCWRSWWQPRKDTWTISTRYSPDIKTGSSSFNLNITIIYMTHICIWVSSNLSDV